MEQINTWVKGMVTDMSYLKVDPSTYLLLRGGNIITLEGRSSGAIESTRGEKFLFRFPTVPAIHKFSFSGLSNGSLIFQKDSQVIEIPLSGIPTNISLYQNITNNSSIQQWITDGELRIDYSEDFDNISVWFHNPDITLTQNGSLDYRITPRVDNPQVLGGEVFGEEVVLITTGEIPESNGQIWKIKINGGEIELADGTLVSGVPLIVDEHLMYSDNLNLSTEHYLTKVITNLETENIGRIYFNDTINPIRSLNLRVDYPMNTPLEMTASHSPNFAFISIVESISGGTIPVPSKVQYFYRFKSMNQGNQSVVYPGSNLMILTEYNSKEPSLDSEYRGTAESEEGRAVKIRLTGLDTNYKSVEIILGIYETPGVQNYYVVDEVPIPPSGELEYINTGYEEQARLDPLEIANRVSNVTSANDIAVHENRMVVFGPEMKNIELDFDTRAYRFNSEQKALLKDNVLGDIILNDSPDWDSVPEKHDAINPYNNVDDHIHWYNHLQYKYQADGHTLGGEGKNISYRFTTLRLKPDANVESQSLTSPYIRQSRYASGETFDFGNGRIYNVGNEFRDFRSPVIDSIAKGYARGEVYRFFFNGYDKLGNPTYASWIADIRMPEEWDASDYLTTGSSGSIFDRQVNNKFIVGDKVGSEMHVYSLGLEFTIKNLDKLKDKISAYSISVVPRKWADKSKLAHGLLEPTLLYEYSGTINSYNYINSPLGSRLHYMEASKTSLESSIHNIMTLNSLDDYKFDLFQYEESDYIRQESIYEVTKNDLRLSHFEIPHIYAMMWAGTNHIHSYSPFHTIKLDDSVWRDLRDNIKIQDLKTLQDYANPGHIEYTMVLSSDYNLFGEYIMNFLDAYHGGKFYHPRNRVLLGKWNKRIEYRGKDVFGNYVMDDFPSPLNSGDPDHFITGSYRRKPLKQYGGNTYTDRQRNLSHPVTPMIKLDESKVKVFSGDTCVSYFPFYRMSKRISKSFIEYIEDDTEIPVNNFKRHGNTNYVQYAATESCVNPYHFSGKSWLLDESNANQYYNMDVDDFINRIPLSYVPENYMQSVDVYHQSDTSKTHLAKERFTNDNNVFPAGILLSELKLNGDSVDSWMKFPLNQLKEVDNKYGAIIYGESFGHYVMFIQERALGVQVIDERALTQSQNTTLVLGEGRLLGEHNYMSTDKGTLHNSSVVKTDTGIFYYSSHHNKIYLFNGEQVVPFTNIAGIYSLMKENVDSEFMRRNNDPLHSRGVVAGYDHLTNRVMYSFHKEGNTFNLALIGNMAESIPYSSPKIYVGTNGNLLMPNPNISGEVYINNRGSYNTTFGRSVPMVIKFLVSSHPELEKVLTNLLWKSECYNETGEDLYGETISRIRIYNNYQDTGYQNNIRRTLRQWAHKVGMNSLSQKKIDRIRNEWNIVELVYDNPMGNRLVLHDVISIMNISHSGITPY